VDGGSGYVTMRGLMRAYRARVAAVPVDQDGLDKVRARAAPPEGEIKVLGWDASGIVLETGPQTTVFQAGDEVWYAGSIARPGTNAELHLVDERIVGRKPRSLDHSQAAAMLLTSITAWELLFDRLAVAPGKAPCDGSLHVRHTRRHCTTSLVNGSGRSD